MKMPSLNSQYESDQSVPVSCSSINALRASFFSNAGSVASRYGISFDDVLMHLWGARRQTGRINLNLVLHLDDLTHATACAMNIDRAWGDLVEQYERWLTRRLRPQTSQIDALLEVRRLLNKLRLGNHESKRGIPLTLAVFRGYVPMKVWLANALIECSASAEQLPRALEITGRLANPGTHSPRR